MSIRRSLRRIRFLARAEILHIVRDRATLAQIVVLPIVQLLVLSNVATFRVRETPAVVVGQQVNVPVVGTYQMFFLYPLDAEQQRLDFLLGTLALAAAALVVLLAATTWLVTRQTVRPVRRAAEVAERLADGHLTERMPEHGEDEMATLAHSFNEMAASLQDQIARLEELAVQAAHEHESVDVAVCHLAARDAAQRLADGLCSRLSGALRGKDVTLQEVGAVLGAHVGPGLLGVVVTPQV